jgi:MoxR-like ATPase
MDIKKVIKQDDNYICDIDISVEEWKKILQNEILMSDTYKDALIKFYNEPEHKSTCKALEKKYGVSFRSFVSRIMNFSKAVQKKLNRFEIVGTTGEPTYWVIPMTGKYIDDNHFEWTIRPELVQAMEETNFTINEYQKFKCLLEYFVTHLLYITDNIDINNLNSSNYKKYEKYIKPIKNFKKTGQGYTKEGSRDGDAIQNQIKQWSDYQKGEICINIQYNQKAGFKAKTNYLNWDYTNLNIIAEWDNNSIKKLAQVKYQKWDNIKYANLGQSVSLSNLGLFDNQEPNDALKEFFNRFENLIKERKKQENNKKIMVKIKSHIDLIEANKNVILTGAPGTGKTYLAKDIAEKLIFNEVSSDKKRQAERLKDSEQFKLVQFHPAYSYEDFVRGIVVKTDNGQIAYETENKILGKLAEVANDNYKNAQKQPDVLSKEQWVEEQIEHYKNYILEEELPDKITVKLTKAAEIISVEKGGFRCIRYVKDNTGFILKYGDIIHAYIGMYLNSPSIKIKENQTLSKSARSDMYYLYQNVVDLFKTFLDAKGISYTNHIATHAAAPRVFEKNYVLIIDEINRANLPAVLGELIYALEYRGETVESMYATDEEENSLILPPNLYIIGTMNTADRSVGQIDYAIRRRFAFEIMLPGVLKDEDLQEGQTFDSELFNDVSKLFVEEVKANIDELKPSDHLSAEFRPEDVWLGHSYFIMSENKPRPQRLKYEIKPILREYLKDGIFKSSAEKIINELR